MITSKDLDVLKQQAHILSNINPAGMVIAISNRNEITWKAASNTFDIPVINVGTSIRTGGGPYLAMQKKEKTTEKVPASAYGMRLLITTLPVIDDNEVVGSIIYIVPEQHSIAAAFNEISPILEDMFTEGVCLYITDTVKTIAYHPSSKFDIPHLKVGDQITEKMVAHAAMKNKQKIVQELDQSVLGMPALIMCYPVFAEDNRNEVVGTFGAVLPRKTSNELRLMSDNLQKNLEEASSVVQQLAASASQIANNEHLLNGDILDISKTSEEINEVMGFINEIADETKMLGLNAAIEAARAGEFGRGFGVVAGEIRKLSDESKGTVVKVRGLIQKISEKVEHTIKNSEMTLRSNEEQAAATEELSVSIRGITEMAEQLRNITQAMRKK